MWRRLLIYARGFLEEGQPQSSARLCAVLTTVAACIVALIGVLTKWDCSMIVLALGGSGVGSLWQRKPSDPLTPKVGA